MVYEIAKSIEEGIGQQEKSCKNTLFGLVNGISYYYQNNKEYTTKQKC
jgi:hypothetical protein